MVRVLKEGVRATKRGVAGCVTFYAERLDQCIWSCANSDVVYKMFQDCGLHRHKERDEQLIRFAGVE